MIVSNTRDSPVLLLGPLLRRGSDGGVSVWVETSAPCEVRVLESTAQTFCIATCHYAIVELPSLLPGDVLEYQVHLDDQLVWPDRTLPDCTPALYKGWTPGATFRISGGSCRQQAPQNIRRSRRERFSSSSAPVTDALGADALAALAYEIQQGRRELPHLLLLTGDQVYADERHPSVTNYLRNRRGGPPKDGFPEVASFTEYSWLYQRTWSHPLIRWLLASVPSLMIFDDHDVIDDWNISDTWAREIGEEPWWQDRLDSALMSYWVYQHLGNMSAEERSTDDLYARVQAVDDGADLLREFASRVGSGEERYTVSWSYNVHYGPVNIIVLDARNGRVLEPGDRSMLSPRDWDFLDRAIGENPNVLLVSSVPWLLPPGVHSLERLVSQMVAGRWGRWSAKLGERIRQEIDLEHWAAFGRSVEELTGRLRLQATRTAHYPPLVFSGDVHFAYVAEQPLTDSQSAYQIVSSPLRQGDANYEQVARWAAMTATFDRTVRRLAGRGFRRMAPKVGHKMLDGVWTDNNIASLSYDPAGVAVSLDKAVLTAEGLKLSNLMTRFLWVQGVREHLPGDPANDAEANKVGLKASGLLTNRLFSPPDE